MLYYKLNRFCSKGIEQMEIKRRGFVNFFYSLPSLEIMKKYENLDTKTPKFGYFMIIMDNLLDEKDKFSVFTARDLENIDKIEKYQEESETKEILKGLINEPIILDPYLQLNKKEESEHIDLLMVKKHLEEILDYPIFLGDLPSNVDGITLLNKTFLINSKRFQNFNKELAAYFEISYIRSTIGALIMIHEMGHSKRILGYGGGDLKQQTPKKFAIKEGKKAEAGFFIETSLFGWILDLEEIKQNEKIGIFILTLLKEKVNWHSRNLLEKMKSQLDSDTFYQLTNLNLKISKYRGGKQETGFGILQII